MRLALDQAQNAWLVGEVPVGAVIMRDGDGRRSSPPATTGRSPTTTRPRTPRSSRCATRRTLLGNYRLPECELYVTLEPCAMCAMALMHARFKRVVFGARRSEDRRGRLGGRPVRATPRSTTTPQVAGGVLADECGEVLRDVLRRAPRAVPAAPRPRRRRWSSRRRRAAPIPAGEALEIDAEHRPPA